MTKSWKRHAYRLTAFSVSPRNSPPLSDCRIFGTSVDAIIRITTGAISVAVFVFVAPTSHLPEWWSRYHTIHLYPSSVSHDDMSTKSTWALWPIVGENNIFKGVWLVRIRELFPTHVGHRSMTSWTSACVIPYHSLLSSFNTFRAVRAWPIPTCASKIIRNMSS